MSDNYLSQIVEYERGKRALGTKSVTLNEPHFTGQLLQPGVSLEFPAGWNEIEIALAQTAFEALIQLASILSLADAKQGVGLFIESVDGVKRKEPVLPGDELMVEVEMKDLNKMTGNVVVTGTASVDGEVVAKLELIVWKAVTCSWYTGSIAGIIHCMFCGLLRCFG